MPGSEDLRLPDELRDAVRDHLNDIREGHRRRGFGDRVGFGERPAVIVIDLAKRWLDPKYALGSDLEQVLENTCKVVESARQAEIPIFFTTVAYGPDDPEMPADLIEGFSRVDSLIGSDPAELDPRLGRRPTEKLLVKKYASCFKGTDLHEMLTSLRVDTLIVTGCSTSGCVYATCRDAVSSFRVIVPEEAVGERCELFHLVNLLEIDLGMGDVLPLADVLGYLERIAVTGKVVAPA